jgi:hypothetical protein
MKIYIDPNRKIEYSTCHGCDTGYGSYSGGRDEKGEWTEITSCQDNCTKLKLYQKTK